MLDATFVQKVVDLAAVQEFSVPDLDGVAHQFTSKQVFEAQPKPPNQAEIVKVCTLSGFAALVEEKIDGLDTTKFFIHVVDHETVELVATETDKYGRRLALIKAEPVKFQGFTFGQWLKQEDFIIAVAAKFCQSDGKDYVLRVASTMTSEATSISEDDGFSQKVNAKAGIKTAEIIKVNGIVDLAPFRTFPEVGQPVSQFVFRAKATDNGPLLMLVEADGGKWKIDAIKEVQGALSKMALEPTIVA